MSNRITLNELFSRSFRTFKENWVNLFIFALIIGLMNSLSLVLISIHLVFIVLIISIIIGILIYIRIYYFVSGEESSWESAWETFRKRLFPLLKTGIIWLILLILLFIALIIPGVIFYIFWTFALYAALYRDESGMSALKYSKSLVEDNWWRAFGYGLLFSFVVGVAVLVLSAIVTAVHLGIIGVEDVSAIEQGSLFDPALTPVNFVFEFISSFISSFVSYFAIIGHMHFFLALEKEKGMSSGAPDHRKEDESIKEYLMKNKDSYSKEDLVKALLNAGYHKSDIDKEIKEIYR